MKPIYWVALVVVIAFVIAVGAMWYISNTRTETTTNTNIPLPTTSPSTTPSAQVSPLAEITNLKAVGNYSGSGTATRTWDGQTFTHTVTASINDPAEGKFIEGWLVNMSKDPKFFSTGNLKKEGGVWKLTYTTNKNYQDYNEVVITEETSAKGNDGVPEAHVLEGSF